MKELEENGIAEFGISGIGEHIETLIRCSDFLLEKLKEYVPASRSRFIDQLQKIDNVRLGDESDPDYELNANKRLREYFVTVQNKDAEHLRLPKGWRDYITDSEYKNALYEISKGYLDRFNTLIASRGIMPLEFYGGIKPKQSLEKKLKSPNSFGERISQFEIDIRDVVRFRFVFSTVPQMEQACVLFWRTFFEAIVACKNYYYIPKSTDIRNPYRAIHFEVAFLENSIMEVQFLTENRHIVSVLDYSLFKNLIPSSSEATRSWLTSLRRKANVLDANSLAQR